MRAKIWLTVSFWMARLDLDFEMRHGEEMASGTRKVIVAS
jgi:hypothetical protein